MHLTLLVFLVLAIVRFQRSPESAVLDVFLPVLLLIPAGYLLSVPHLPPLSAASLAVLPIAIGVLLYRWDRWRFQRADLWILIYVLASGYTDYLNIGLMSALDTLPSTACESIFAYVIGKLLIEQTGIRERFVQRFVFLLAATGFVSILEFVGRQDLFMWAGRLIFFSSTWDYIQMRDGFRRVNGPFVGPEAAGIVFMMGFILSLWLWFLHRSRQDAGEPRYLGLRRSALCVLGIALGLFMTLSRGPWIGATAGFVIARIGFVKNTRLAMVAALVLCVAGGILYQEKLNQLAHSNLENASEELGTAYYRTQLFSLYQKVAEEGGLFGWSPTAYPRDSHADSIDNHYLFLWVARGKVGIWTFVLICAEGAWGITLAIRRSRQRFDTAFYYSLGGILAGFLFVLSTVYLVSQGHVLFFLLIGWSQSLQDQSSDKEGLPQTANSRFVFRRTFA